MSPNNNKIYFFRFDESDWYSMINVYKKSRSAQTFLSNYDYEDVGVFTLTTHSANTWSISPPELESMINQLNAPSNVLNDFLFYLN